MNSILTVSGSLISGSVGKEQFKRKITETGATLDPKLNRDYVFIIESEETLAKVQKIMEVYHPIMWGITSK